MSSVASSSKREKSFKMLDEIMEQPFVIEKLLNKYVSGYNVDIFELLSRTKEIKLTKRIFILGCGSSKHAGMYGEYLMEEMLGLNVEVEYANEYRYKKNKPEENTLVIAISQSGETKDTIEALKKIDKKKNLVVAITNISSSSISKLSDVNINISAGTEHSMAATKSFAGTAFVLILLSFFLRKILLGNKLSKAEKSDIFRLPKNIKDILGKRAEIEQVAASFKKVESFIILGKQFNYPISLEGALKLKEVANVHAEGYPFKEFMHGPVSFLDKKIGVLALLPMDTQLKNNIKNLSKIKKLHTKILSIASNGSKMVKPVSDQLIYTPKTIEILEPFMTLVPLQLFTYYLAFQKRKNIDNPRALKKAIITD